MNEKSIMDTFGVQQQNKVEGVSLIEQKDALLAMRHNIA